MRLAGVAILALASTAAACGQESNDRSSSEPREPSVLTAADLGNQVALTAADYLATEPYASADRANGLYQAQLCLVWHSLERGAPHRIGPNLYGFFGRQNADQADFEYSEAMREVRFHWTPVALDAWLSEPARFLPGNRVSFIGIHDADDRADLIAYLLEATSEPQ